MARELAEMPEMFVCLFVLVVNLLQQLFLSSVNHYFSISLCVHKRVSFSLYTFLDFMHQGQTSVTTQS